MARTERWDVVVVGAGNAALTAAVSAKSAGARVLVLEKGSQSQRGGNTYFTGGSFRFAYKPEDVFELMPDMTKEESASYEWQGLTPDEYFADIMRVTQGQADPALVEKLVRESLDTIRFMQSHGMRYGLVGMPDPCPLRGNRLYFTSRASWLGAAGGGPGLSDQLFGLLEKKGVPVLYETMAVKLLVDRRSSVRGVTVKDKQGCRDISSKAVVLACGSYEANPEMRLKYLGANWELLTIRGTRYNTGDGLVMALALGAQPGGHWGCAHAAQIDLNAPEIPDRSLSMQSTRSSYPLGIVVNCEGKRFADEGGDWRPFTYTKFGRAIITTQSQQRAFQIFDSQVVHLLSHHYRSKTLTPTSVAADTIEELGHKLGIITEALAHTVAEYNAGVKAGSGVWDISTLDGKYAVGITPPRANWAREIEQPPFVAYPVKPGITFAFAGLKVNERLQVHDTQGEAIPGLYAAGEMAGFWRHNYIGGTGLMWGSVSGRTAGAEATGL